MHIKNIACYDHLYKRCQLVVILITAMLSGEGSVRIRIIIMTLMTVIIILQSPPAFLCGRNFVYTISFNLIRWHYESENHGLERLKNLNSVWGRICTRSCESCTLIITLLLVIITLGELGFWISNPLSVHWSGNWGRVVSVIPPNNTESQSQLSECNKRQMRPFSLTTR